MTNTPPNPTTRRYPRTLHEAFAHDALYACAIERYRRPSYDFFDIALILTGALGVALVCALLFLS